MSELNTTCACCKYLTVGDSGTYEICPVCYWQDDLSQNMDSNYAGGANDVCLSEAQMNYSIYGAIEIRVKKYVREPLPNEIPEGIK